MWTVDCGCTLTDDGIYSPCYTHYELLADSLRFMALTDGEIDTKKSLELGVPIIKSIGKTWLDPKKYQELLKKWEK